MLQTNLRLCVSLLLFGAPAAADDCPRYTVTIIQAPECPPFGYFPTNPTAINEDGTVVGEFCTCICGSHKAFSWTNETGFVILDEPPGTTAAEAKDINDAGVIVCDIDVPGFSSIGLVNDHGRLSFIYPPVGTFLTTNAINTGGLVAGVTSDGTSYFKAFVWRSGTLQLILPSYGTRSLAWDVNDDGSVVGWMGLSVDSDAHPFLYDGRRLIDLGLLENAFSGEARAVNSRQQVVGAMRLPDGEAWTERAFLWDARSIVELPPPQGFVRTSAHDINNHGQIVGRCDEPSQRACLWENGVPLDLNDLIVMHPDLFFLENAISINEGGEIVARAVDMNGDSVVALLRPLDPCDLDGDCIVDQQDPFLLLTAWGRCNVCCADFNDDQEVNVHDLLILLGNWTE